MGQNKGGAGKSGFLLEGDFTIILYPFNFFEIKSSTERAIQQVVALKPMTTGEKKISLLLCISYANCFKQPSKAQWSQFSPTQWRESVMHDMACISCKGVTESYRGVAVY